MVHPAVMTANNRPQKTVSLKFTHTLHVFFVPSTIKKGMNGLQIPHFFTILSPCEESVASGG
jgi:hypothetical protein